MKHVVCLLQLTRRECKADSFVTLLHRKYKLKAYPSVFLDLNVSASTGTASTALYLGGDTAFFCHSYKNLKPHGFTPYGHPGLEATGSGKPSILLWGKKDPHSDGIADVDFSYCEADEVCPC